MPDDYKSDAELLELAKAGKFGSGKALEVMAHSRKVRKTHTANLVKANLVKANLVKARAMTRPLRNIFGRPSSEDLADMALDEVDGA